jgi:DEAD/DEAH box helicase domain-containing protein
MKTPSYLLRRLGDMYLRYLDSPFALRYGDLTLERRALLNQDGRLFRQPLVEPIPAYVKTGVEVEATLSNLWNGTPDETYVPEVASFILSGAFRPGWQLFAHQEQVLRHSSAGHDVVITTGTGSGKTESFLLPIIASLVKESTTWLAPNPRDPQWDWWRHYTLAGNSRRWAPRISQRQHETRVAAIRALILYPMNALVEDQLLRLREALDSCASRQWLSTHRHNNRFYFGRYTGRTPVSGSRTDRSALNRLRDEMIGMDQEAQLVANLNAARFFMTLDGAEMWSRWDMQEAAPDVFITNYSMLNIMLMRSLEAAIFDSTRVWLAQSTDHVFHLVVDELHTYRGTPGTEVAYLLRVLFDRLGLAPDSPS